MEPVSIPPPRRALSCFDPVSRQMSSERRMWNSVAVVKPMGTSLEAGALAAGCEGGYEPSCITRSALASDMPLMVMIVFFGLF